VNIGVGKSQSKVAKRVIRRVKKSLEEVLRVLYQVIYYPTSRLDQESARVNSKRRSCERTNAKLWKELKKRDNQTRKKEKNTG
jgi:hypothetical protein